MTKGELVLLVWNDLVGLSRTRGVPLEQYERRRRHGLGWALAGQSLTPFEDIAPNPWGPMDEVRQVPDEATRRRIVAGVHRHLRALVAITAPSPVSSMRLGPHHWSCGFDAVGVQNREAAIRICPAPDGDPAAFNIEIRSTDATASPYLAIGAIIRAGLEGIRADLAPPAMVNLDPASLSDAERRDQGIRTLPGSLDVALDAFLADDSVYQWFDPVMIEAYGALKRLEAANAAAMSDAELCRRYRCAY